MPKKIVTTVTAGRNGGIHCTKSYKKATDWLDSHTFTNAQLWHVVFKGSDNRADYEDALDRLCEKLRDTGMEVEWKAAYEIDPMKGFHRHVFLMIEAAKHKPSAIIQYREGGWLVEMLKKHGLTFYIAPPRGEIHLTSIGKQKKYAYVPKKPGAKLSDCKEWISYIYKARSKEGVQGPIYSSSRKKAKKPAPQAQPARQATEQLNNEGTNTMIEHLQRAIAKAEAEAEAKAVAQAAAADKDAAAKLKAAATFQALVAAKKQTRLAQEAAAAKASEQPPRQSLHWRTR
jgi:hypothetical protein